MAASELAKQKAEKKVIVLKQAARPAQQTAAAADLEAGVGPSADAVAAAASVVGRQGDLLHASGKVSKRVVAAERPNTVQDDQLLGHVRLLLTLCWSTCLEGSKQAPVVMTAADCVCAPRQTKTCICSSGRHMSSRCMLRANLKTD